MSGNTLGTLYCVTSFGESHGPAIGCVVDGCPPGLALDAADIQRDLDRRKPGTSRHVTQRRESDTVEILSGVFEGRTTGTPIALLIRNEDSRSKDYAAIADTFRHRLGGVDLSGLVATFEDGTLVETGELVSGAELLEAIGPVDGLAKILGAVGIDDVDTPGLAAAGLEFALEGLYLLRRLSKEVVDDRTLYSSR